MKNKLRKGLAGFLAGVLLLSSEGQILAAGTGMADPVSEVQAQDAVIDTQAGESSPVTEEEIAPVPTEEEGGQEEPAGITDPQGGGASGEITETEAVEEPEETAEGLYPEDTPGEDQEPAEEEMREAVDWSAQKDRLLFYPEQIKEQEGSEFLDIQLSFPTTEEEDPICPGDKAVLPLPVQWMQIEDQLEPGEIIAYLLDEEDREESLGIKIGEYTIENGDLTIQFTEGIGTPEILGQMTEIFGRISLAFTWKEEVRKVKDQNVVWVLQDYGDGTKNEAELTIPSREAQDWSSKKDGLIFEISQVEEDGPYLLIDMEFGPQAIQEGLKTADQVMLSLPTDWIVPGSIEDTCLYGERKTEDLATQDTLELGTYVLEGDQIRILFGEGIEEVQDLSDLHCSMRIPFTWKEGVQTEKAQDVVWSLQTYEDGTQLEGNMTVPPVERSQEEQAGEGEEQEEDEEEKNGAQQLFAWTAQPLADTFSLGGQEFKNSGLKYEATSEERDIYWIDNNDGQQIRPEIPQNITEDTTDKIVFSADFTYTKDGQTVVLPLENMDWDSVKGDNGSLNVTDLGGTGHWVLRAQNLLSQAAILIDGQEYQGTFSDWQIHPKDNDIPVFGAQEDYASAVIYGKEEDGTPVDHNGLVRPGAGYRRGWFYVEKTEYTAEILIRSGTTDFDRNALIGAVQDAYSFFWETGILQEGQDVNAGSVSLDAFRDSMEIQWGEDANTGLLTGNIRIWDLERYNLDGSELIFCVDGKEHQDVKITEVKTSDGKNQLTDGDHFIESVENNAVGNWGTNTTEVHNGGKLILTLTGYTDYTATKEWHDKADPSDRPRVEFHLWRFTEKEDTDIDTAYQTAAPVKATKGDEKGQTAVYVIQEGSDQDKISFDFDEQFEPIEDERYLPKYDPEGYNYVYLTKEYMSGESADRYETRYGYLDKESDTFVDTLPEGYGTERQALDNSVYNRGTVSNILTGTTTAAVEKIWIADAFQSELSDVIVELTLQKREVKEGQGPEDDWENTEICYDMGKDTPFIAESLSQSWSTTQPKYGNDGERLQYRWVETGVYQDGEKTEDLLEGDTFRLIQKGQTVAYKSEAEITEEEPFKTTITNKIQDETQYYLEKIWDGIEERAIQLVMYRTDSKNQQQRLSTDKTDEQAPFVLDGTVDPEPTDLYHKGEKVGQVQETESWYAEFTKLDMYDTDGSMFDYFVLEGAQGDWNVQYGTKEENGTVIQTITNGPIGNVKKILLRKRWLDDGDEQHRGAVTYGIYEIPEDKVESITQQVLAAEGVLVQKTVLDRSHDWWKEVTLFQGVDLDRILVLELEVAATEEGESSVGLPYTDEQLQKIYDLQHGKSGVGSPYISYTTKYHPYEATYSMVELEDNPFYTVTNRRLGNIDIEVTKNWVDGSGNGMSEQRKSLLKELEKKGYELVFQLTATGSGDGITPVIKDDTVQVGNEAVPILDDKKNSVGSVQKIDTENNTSVYYFYNLPKYDLYGKLVSYSVKEMLRKTTGEDAGSIVKISDVINRKEGNTFDYQFSIAQSGYQVVHNGDEHDKQTFVADNRLQGTKEIFFWKEWNDAYRYQQGERPDIYLSLYQVTHDGEGKEQLSDLYLDRRWTFNDESVSHCDFGDMPKYDAYGYEIIYYAQEKILTDKAAFDYTNVYYKYDERLEDKDTQEASQLIDDLDKVGDEEGAVDEDRIGNILYQNKDGVWLLKEYGVFVNELAADVFVNGKKIWANIPSGFLEEDLPPVTFDLYQFNTKDGTIPEDQPYPAENKIAWLTVSHWEQQKVKGEYLFKIAFRGKNTNSKEEGQIVAQGTGKLPKYDEEGNLYEYRISESVDFDSTEAGDLDLVFQQPTINNYAITNPYDPPLGEIRVKKLLDKLAFEDPTKNKDPDPSVSFKLTRKYKGQDGNLKDDLTFSQIKTIGYDEFQNGSGEVLFEELALYAPNGSRYVYMVQENPEGSQLIQGGYKVYSGKGELDSDTEDGKWQEGDTVTELYPKETSGTFGTIFRSLGDIPSLLGLGAGEEEDTSCATFKNVYENQKAPLYFGKKWIDGADQAGMRLRTVTFDVKRSADPQPGYGNSIGEYSVGTMKLTLDDQQFDSAKVELTKGSGLSFSAGSYLETSDMIQKVTIQTMESVSDPDSTKTLAETERWVITVESVEVYATNGMPWKYKLTEVVDPDQPYTASKNNIVFTYDKEKMAYSDITTAATSGTVFENTINISTKVYKNWRRAVDDTTTYTNPFGYRIVLGTQLYAAGVATVDGKAPDDDRYNDEDLWQPVDQYSIYWEALTQYCGASYDWDRQSTINVNANMSGKQSATSISYDRLPKILKVGEQVLYMKYYVMESGVELKDTTRKTIYKETYTPKFKVYEEVSESYAAQKGTSRLGFWLDTEAEILGADGKFAPTEQILIRPVVNLEKILDQIYEDGLSSVYTNTAQDKPEDLTLYPYVNLDTSKRESTFVNLYDLMDLKVQKTWVDDSENIYGTRESSGGKWKLKFLVQQKGTEEAEEAWEAFKKNAQNVTLTLSGTDNQAEGEGSIAGLPGKGIEGDEDTGYRILDYQYRARETQSVNNEQVVEDQGTYRDSYIVTYEEESEGTTTKITATNTLQTIDLEGEKSWKGNHNDTVTFELKYQKLNGTLASFDTKAQVPLDGEADRDTEGKAYYEDPGWHAIWKGVPQVVPGSKTEQNASGEKRTVYKVVEVTENAYGSVTNGTLTGNGTENDPYVLDGTAASGFSITNQLTELKIEKVVEKYVEGAVVDKEFAFKITGDMEGVDVRYQKYNKGAPGSADTEEGSLTQLPSDGTFTLKDGQYVIFYGLKKGKIYTVRETNAHGYTPAFDITGATGSNGTVTIPSDKPTETPVMTVTNQYYGELTIKKVDEKGQPLSGVTFKLESSDRKTGPWTEVTGGEKTTGADGTVKFDKLELTKYYRITETSVPAGYHKLGEPAEIYLPYETTSQESGSTPLYTVTSGNTTKYYYADVTLTIGNNKALVMPTTAGNGFFWPGLFGPVLIVAVIGGYLYTGRRRRKKSS